MRVDRVCGWKKERAGCGILRFSNLEKFDSEEANIFHSHEAEATFPLALL
jgi:hypothetical protein